MDTRTRSRGKRKHQRADEESEDEGEERMVPVVSGENKRKRAPRSSGRRVKAKAAAAAVLENSARDDADNEGVSESTEEAETEPVEQEQSERRRERSLRLKIKPFKLRESADADSASKPGRRGNRETAEEDEPIAPPKRSSAIRAEVASPEPPQKRRSGVQPKVVVTPVTQTKVPPVIVQTPKVPMPKSPPPVVLKTPVAASVPKTPLTPVSMPVTDDEMPESELEISLKVIRKIMKMDAAHPFNKPVDPIAQGVPDYLDIIDTPMDFGTIADNLEKGVKYRNALDVYRDIQQVWINCRKYNHKGDPILELMKKVQKACSKYFTASGVLREPKRSKKGEGSPPPHAPPQPLLPPPPVVMAKPLEVTISKPRSPPSDDHKSRPGAGTTSHKPSCTCVVCTAVRRKNSREKRAVGLGSARAVKRQPNPKTKPGKLGQDLNELEMEDADEGFIDHEEEADHFYPSSYQIPLRPINPTVLSLSKVLFGCKRASTPRPTDNPMAALVTSLVQR